MSAIVLLAILQVPVGLLSNVVANYVQQLFDGHSKYGQWATKNKLILFAIMFVAFQVPALILTVSFANEEKPELPLDTFSGQREFVTIQSYSAGSAFKGELIIDVKEVTERIVLADISSPGYPGKTLSVLEGKVGGSFCTVVQMYMKSTF